MMKRILALLLCLMLALPIDAFAESEDSADSEFDLSADQEKIAELGVPYYVVDTDIAEVIFEARKESNPCSLCSKMRRGALNNKAI